MDEYCYTRGDHAEGWCSRHSQPLVMCVSQSELNRLRSLAARAGDGVALRQAIREGIGEFAERHPKWWKRIDGTPIPNDIEVNIAAAVSRWIRGEE